MSSWSKTSTSKIFSKTKFGGKQQQQSQHQRRRNRNRNRRNRNHRRRVNNIINNNGRPHSFPLIVMITETDSDDENSDDEQLNRILGRFGASNRQQTEQQQRQQEERQILAINNELQLFSQSITQEIEGQLNEEFDANELYYNRLYKILDDMYRLVIE